MIYISHVIRRLETSAFPSPRPALNSAYRSEVARDPFLSRSLRKEILGLMAEKKLSLRGSFVTAPLQLRFQSGMKRKVHELLNMNLELSSGVEVGVCQFTLGIGAIIGSIIIIFPPS